MWYNVENTGLQYLLWQGRGNIVYFVNGERLENVNALRDQCVIVLKLPKADMQLIAATQEGK